jgi:hypothetical protein
VLARLFNPSDDCGVNGNQLAVSDTAKLLTEFFVQGQIALGREELNDCEILLSGLPISVVSAIAVKGSNNSGEIAIIGPDGPIASGSPSASAAISELQRSSPGQIRVEVSEGKIERCFSNVDLAITPATPRVAYSGAEKFLIGVVVTGRGSEAVSSGALGSDLVEVTFNVDGRELGATFDEVSRRFTVEWPKITNDLKVSASAKFLLSGLVVNSEDWTISVSDVPPTPTITWSGDYIIENSGQISGSIIVSSGFKKDGAILCVAINSGNKVLSESGELIGTVSLGETEKCGSVNNDLDIPAVISFEETGNKVGLLDISYSSTYQAEQVGSAVDLDPGTARLGPFQVVKGGSGTAGLLFALLVSAVIALCSYLLLFLSALRQGLLPNPSRFLFASSPLDFADQGMRKKLISRSSITAADLKVPLGDRKKFSFGPIEIQRVLPLNPLGELKCKVSVSSGVLLAQGNSQPGRNSLLVPNSFSQLAIGHFDDGQLSLFQLLPLGSKPDDFMATMNSSTQKFEAEAFRLLENATSVPGKTSSIHTFGVKDGKEMGQLPIDRRPATEKVEPPTLPPSTFKPPPPPGKK